MADNGGIFLLTRFVNLTVDELTMNQGGGTRATARTALHRPDQKRCSRKPTWSASHPATETTPAVRGVRLHDLRHTFAVLQLSAGVHFMQVSKWLGHSIFTITPDVYGDYIPEEDGGALNTLLEPPAPAKTAEAMGNVVNLFGRQLG